MDKSKKKQRYSLRKTQLGVGSVLLATVLLTAGTAKAQLGLTGENGNGFGLTESIQGGNGSARIIDKDKNDKFPKKPEQPEPPQKQELGLGLGGSGTEINSLVGPSGSGHEGQRLGQGLSDGNADITSGNGTQGESRVNVPEKAEEPKEKLPETPTPLPRVQDQSQPTPKSKPEETPKAEALKQEAPKVSVPKVEDNQHLFWLYYQKGHDEKRKPAKPLEEIIEKEGFDKPEEKETKIKNAVERYAKEGYPHYDRFDNGNNTLLVFHRYKTYIVLKTLGDNGSKQTSVFYGKNREQDVESKVQEWTTELEKNYDVERSEVTGSNERTITLTLKPKTNEADKPAPDMPKVPEVPKKPDMPQPPVPEVPKKPEKPQDDKKPSVPSKPDVAPKPGDKPSVPSIPEMVPEPEKLEMDKSMKVVPGKPKKATPEAQVPEAQVPQVPQVQVPQSQAPQLPSPKEEVAKVQQQPRAIQSSAPAKSGGKQLPNTGEAVSILTLVGSGMLGLLGLAFTKKRKTK
ncbi:YSIRK-type signal peptide-containing protein [Streptococcus ruminantium]|uniref:YSIRK-type signal peptide-containing protein n=1 Tax=Streptococcus ruminantium TaxID=1917441 RepID=UPI0012DC256E|nr:YSIRK-type signal peptide-containing protein [Streptococcus ruminantium]